MPAQKTLELAIIALPGASQMAIGAILDCFAEINGALEDIQFLSRLYISADHFDLGALRSHPLRDLIATNTVISNPACVVVIAGSPVPDQSEPELVQWLASWAARQIPSASSASALAATEPLSFAAGIGTGAFLLARAGILDGYRCVMHWPFISLLTKTVPGVMISTQQYEIEHQRLSCANAIGVPEMICAWIAKVVDESLAVELAELLGIERSIGQSGPQRVPIAARIGGGQPKLTEAVSLMEANIEEPLPAEDIARLVGVSRRQLERLFKQYLNSLPSRYYLEMRLLRARHLLQNTGMSILQVGLMSGFSSGPHFSSAYRSRFGITPREQRLKPRAPYALEGKA